MARKRKLTPGSGEAQRQKQNKQEQDQQQEQLAEQVAAEGPVPEREEDDQEEVEVEVGGGENGEEEEGDEDDGEEEEEEEEEDEAVKQEGYDVTGGGDEEPIHKLLEPFTKDKLISILCEAAEKHPQIAARVRKIADEDPVHRKIFVHGLGWDTTTDTLRDAFVQYGEIEDCKAVADKVTGKSKGYGFILFKSRSGARKALEQPQKKIANRMTACQLAAVGPVPASGAGGSFQTVAVQQPMSENTQRKIYVSNVGAELDPEKLYAFFADFGEIEEGPLGLDKQTGKPKGFCLFVYKNVESARKALEEPHKNFEGHTLHCQQAIDGPKPGKQHLNQPRNPHYGRNGNMNHTGSTGGVGASGGQMMGQSVSSIPFNHGAGAATAPAAFNPALGQALTALLASQSGLGLQNLLGSLGTAGVGGTPAVAGAGHAIQGGYGNQAVGSSISPGMLGGYGDPAGYGPQAGLQSAYPNQQQGSSRTQHGVGHVGGVAPYTGR